MFKFLGLFSVMLFVIQAPSLGYTKVKTSSTTDLKARITSACIENIKGKQKSDSKKICDCVGRNYITLSNNWAEKKNRIKILEYAEKFYANKLTDAEIDSDPYNLFDMDSTISNGCANDPKFVIKP